MFDELGKYSIAYTAYSKRRAPASRLALTDDLSQLRALRAGDAARRQGRCALAAPDRRALRAHPSPAIRLRAAHIWISYSPDLRNWGGAQADGWLARKGAWWDANKVGLSPPLIETSRGWLMIYHGVRHTAAGLPVPSGSRAVRPRATRPLHLARRLVDLRPRGGPTNGAADVGNVAFPCGYTRGRGRRLTQDLLRRGGYQHCPCDGPVITSLLRWLDEHGTRPEH